MHKKIKTRPPGNFETFSPSELFRFFFKIGHWTEGSFSDDFQNYTRGTLISTVTINKWKNRDVIPTRYSGPLFKMIETQSEPELAKEWISAFETVWALHSAGRRAAKGPLEGSEFSDTICAQHKKWIKQLYTEHRDGEEFSAAQIYVPLQFYGENGAQTKIFDAEDVITEFSKTWTFISGAPGSGKSMSALHMAASLCEGDIFPIYMRGRHFSDIDIDITQNDHAIVDSFSIRSFLKHFRASSFGTACLILDGIDEITQMTQEPAHRLNRILSDLKKEQAACNAHRKTLNIIVLGRETQIRFAMSQIPPDHSRHMSLLSLDGSQRNGEISTNPIQGSDLRPLWWQKYFNATQKDTDPTLPDFLSLDYDDYSEFASDPLLSFLICETAIEKAVNSGLSKLPHEDVNAFTYGSNKNAVYKSIIERAASANSHLLNPHRFLFALQHIALAAWQAGDSQSVALNKIHGSLDTPEVKSAFESLGLGSSAPTPPDIFMTSFYYRLAEYDENPNNMVVEFTQESFPEYLISTLFFDRFIGLISAFETEEKTEEALQAWVFVSKTGAHTPNLAGFCQKEAESRFDKLSHLNWDLALDIIQHHLTARLFDGTGLESLSQFQQSNSLLFFIWSCLNLERQKRGNTHFDLNNNDLNFDLGTLRKFQRPAAIILQSGSLIEPVLNNQSFLTFALSGLKLSFADMSQLSLSLGHMEHVIYADTSFVMTHWSHVKTSEADFTRSLFQQVIFNQWRVLNSQFTNCLFQGARFQGGLFKACQMRDIFFSQCHFSEVEFMAPEFDNVIFDRCVFSESNFSRIFEKNDLSGAMFKHCTFLDMDDVIQTIPTENLTGTISTIQGETNVVSAKPLN